MARAAVTEATGAVEALALACVIASCAAGQSGVLFGFNDAAPSVSLSNVVGVASGGLTIHFTAPVNATIDGIEIASLPLFGVAFAIDLFPTASLGTPPTGPATGSFSVTSLYGASGWLLAPASLVAPLTAGSTYAIRFTGVATTGNPNGCWILFHDPAGPHQLPYQLGAPVCTGPALPLAGQMGPFLRFRGTPTGPGPFASLASIGSGCGWGFFQPQLTSVYNPVLGSNWPVNVSGPPGGLGYLFWSAGVSPAGSIIAPASACRSYLVDQSVQQLAQLGAEPLGTATIGPSGAISGSIGVPSNPSYAGLVVGIQVIIASPAGTIPLGGGVLASTTNALMLTLGF